MKPICRMETFPNTMSPLAQGRGLKPMPLVIATSCPLVAPRAGAWIETRCKRTGGICALSRPSRRGVD